MANDTLSRIAAPIEKKYELGDYKVDFFSNLKDVLGDTLWDTYQKTNTITGGALTEAVKDSYFNIGVDSKDYRLQLEKNAYMDDSKQDYKLTLSKRF